MGGGASQSKDQSLSKSDSKKVTKEDHLIEKSPFDDSKPALEPVSTSVSVSDGKLKKMALGIQSYNDKDRAYDSTLAHIEVNKIQDLEWKVPPPSTDFAPRPQTPQKPTPILTPSKLPSTPILTKPPPPKMKPPAPRGFGSPQFQPVLAPSVLGKPTPALESAPDTYFNSPPHSTFGNSKRMTTPSNRYANDSTEDNEENYPGSTPLFDHTSQPFSSPVAQQLHSSPSPVPVPGFLGPTSAPGPAPARPPPKHSYLNLYQSNNNSNPSLKTLQQQQQQGQENQDEEPSNKFQPVGDDDFLYATFGDVHSDVPIPNKPSSVPSLSLSVPGPSAPVPHFSLQQQNKPFHPLSNPMVQSQPQPPPPRPSVSLPQPSLTSSPRLLQQTGLSLPLNVTTSPNIKPKSQSIIPPTPIPYNLHSQYPYPTNIPGNTLTTSLNSSLNGASPLPLNMASSLSASTQSLMLQTSTAGVPRPGVPSNSSGPFRPPPPSSSAFGMTPSSSLSNSRGSLYGPNPGPPPINPLAASIPRTPMMTANTMMVGMNTTMLNQHMVSSSLVMSSAAGSLTHSTTSLTNSTTSLPPPHTIPQFNSPPGTAPKPASTAFSVRETNDVKRSKAQIPSSLQHEKPTTGNWIKKRYIVNNYILLDVLGSGSYGEVRLCKDRNDEKIYAIKIVSKDLLKKKKTSTSSETFMDDIKREIAIMKKALHPNVLRLFEVLDDPKVNKIYLVLEYMKNGDLINFLKEREKEAASSQQQQQSLSTSTSTSSSSNSDSITTNSESIQPSKRRDSASKITPLSDLELWQISRQVCKGMSYLHKQNIVHGDIKPQNLLVGDQGVVKIADFGISKILSSSGQQLVDAAGTPAFMSPEILEKGKFSGQLADVWAIGATLFMLRFGHPPYVAKHIIKLYDKIKNDPLEFPTSLDPKLEDLLRGMMRKIPEERLTLEQVIAHPWLKQPPGMMTLSMNLPPQGQGLSSSKEGSVFPSISISGINNNSSSVSRQTIMNQQQNGNMNANGMRGSDSVPSNTNHNTGQPRGPVPNNNTSSILTSVSAPISRVPSFLPPPSYESEEREAMSRVPISVESMDHDEIYQSIGMRMRKTNPHTIITTTSNTIPSIMNSKDRSESKQPTSVVGRYMKQKKNKQKGVGGRTSKNDDDDDEEEKEEEEDNDKIGGIIEGDGDESDDDLGETALNLIEDDEDEEEIEVPFDLPPNIHSSQSNRANNNNSKRSNESPLLGSFEEDEGKGIPEGVFDKADGKSSSIKNRIDARSSQVKSGGIEDDFKKENKNNDQTVEDDEEYSENILETKWGEGVFEMVDDIDSQSEDEEEDEEEDVEEDPDDEIEKKNNNNSKKKMDPQKYSSSSSSSSTAESKGSAGEIMKNTHSKQLTSSLPLKKKNSEADSDEEKNRNGTEDKFSFSSNSTAISTLQNQLENTPSLSNAPSNNIILISSTASRSSMSKEEEEKRTRRFIGQMSKKSIKNLASSPSPIESHSQPTGALGQPLSTNINARNQSGLPPTSQSHLSSTHSSSSSTSSSSSSTSRSSSSSSSSSSHSLMMDSTVSPNSPLESLLDQQQQQHQQQQHSQLNYLSQSNSNSNSNINSNISNNNTSSQSRPPIGVAEKYQILPPSEPPPSSLLSLSTSLSSSNPSLSIPSTPSKLASEKNQLQLSSNTTPNNRKNSHSQRTTASTSSSSSSSSPSHSQSQLDKINSNKSLHHPSHNSSTRSNHSTASIASTAVASGSNSFMMVSSDFEDGIESDIDPNELTMEDFERMMDTLSERRIENDEEIDGFVSSGGGEESTDGEDRGQVQGKSPSRASSRNSTRRLADSMRNRQSMSPPPSSSFSSTSQPTLNPPTVLAPASAPAPPSHLRNPQNGVSVSFHSEQGKRDSQEDRCVLLPDASQMRALSNYTFEGNDEEIKKDLGKFSIACVFDGHNGWRCAQYLSQHLPGRLVTHKRFLDRNPDQALDEVCESLDSQICELLRSEEDDSGSTALICLYDGRKHMLTIANVGDCLCVLSRGGRAVQMNKSHRVHENAEERARIEKEDGNIVGGRLNGVLAVSRAFGDVAHKDPGPDLSRPRRTLIAQPETCSEVITPMTEFAIIASDGLWDVLTPQSAVNFVRKRFTKRIPLSLIPKQLCDEALLQGSLDNITVLILQFHSEK